MRPSILHLARLAVIGLLFTRAALAAEPEQAETSEFLSKVHQVL